MIVPALFAMMNPLAILAAADSLPTLPAPYQYGILGFAVITLASAKVVVPIGWLKDEQTARKREQERGDRMEAEVKRLNEAFGDKAIPALVEASQAMQASNAVLQQVLRDRK